MYPRTLRNHPFTKSLDHGSDGKVKVNLRLNKNQGTPIKNPNGKALTARTPPKNDTRNG